MKTISIKSLSIPDVKIIRFARFNDNRGFFTEPFRQSDTTNLQDVKSLSGASLLQMNESYSSAGVCRGLHFQWKPFMGKLVRTIHGRMIDVVLDIRKGSPTLGKVTAYDMPGSLTDPHDEWIWVPPGFAHGNFFTADSRIEYLCTGEYSPNSEAGVSPLSTDLDWSLCPPELKSLFDEVVRKNGILSEKDRNGLSLKKWLDDSRSDNFVYGKC